MTENEIKLKLLDKVMEESIVEFNTIHRKAKYLKRDINKMFLQRAELTKMIYLDNQTGAFAD